MQATLPSVFEVIRARRSLAVGYLDRPVEREKLRADPGGGPLGPLARAHRALALGGF
ncbi:MAG: hypothetical protein RML14_06775 [Meiothermus sp.]|uniref:hypothetical protein n=1 Tax=Meiothermus sp. TaxID=1955249 RepID=UPI00298EF572|nr:hypothetical protein [Meiothermus sp.]MDW8481570.1 hypothetical protein [Meiothermus sp.]